MKIEEAGRVLAVPPSWLVPPDATCRLLAALHGVPEVENLALEHEVGGKVAGYGFGATRAQLAATSRPLPPTVQQWIARRELWEASPFAFLEYDGDHGEFDSPHVFFRLLSFESSSGKNAFVDLLLEEGDTRERRTINRTVQRLIDRLPWNSRSGYVGCVSRGPVRELRVQLPIDVHEIRPLIDDVAGPLGEGIESILGALERAELHRINLQLGVGTEGVARRMGIELGISHWQPRAPKVWRNVVDELVDANTSTIFREQLDGWWGLGDNPSSHARWSHVKLAATGDQIELKHYLWLKILEEQNEMGEPNVGQSQARI